MTTKESSTPHGSVGFTCQGCGEPMPSFAVAGCIPAGFTGCPKCHGCSWVGTFMVGGSPAPLSESGEHEGYPGIAHDFEEIRSALRDLRDYVAAEHGIGGIQPLVPDCPKCERIKKLDALLWRAQTPPSARGLKDAWIPVSERLPDDDLTVLIAIDMPEAEGEPVWLGWHGEYEGKSTWIDSQSGCEITVTHWQPLPEARRDEHERTDR